MEYLSDHIYLIEYKKNFKKFFFYELVGLTEISDKWVLQVKWTPYIKHAFLFDTEQNVEEFKADYLSPRKVSIIRLPADKFRVKGELK